MGWAGLIGFGLAVLFFAAAPWQAGRFSPVPRQETGSDCGYAVARGITSMAGLNLPNHVPPGPMTMLELANFLKEAGLEYIPVAAGAADILSPIAAHEPVILRLDKPRPHYVLALGAPGSPGAPGRRVAISDPAAGRKTLSAGQFEAAYSGYALVPAWSDPELRATLSSRAAAESTEAARDAAALAALGGSENNHIVSKKIALECRSPAENPPTFSLILALTQSLGPGIDASVRIGTAPSVSLAIDTKFLEDPLVFGLELDAAMHPSGSRTEPPALRAIAAVPGIGVRVSAGFLAGDACYLESGFCAGLELMPRSASASQLSFGSLLGLRMPIGARGAVLGVELEERRGEGEIRIGLDWPEY